MDNQEKNKALLWTMAIILLLVLGYFLYKQFVPNEELNYTMVKELVGTFYNSEEYEKNTEFYLEYPVLKTTKKELIDLNTKIKEKVEKNLEDLNNYESLSDDPDETVCDVVKMKKSDEKIIFNRLERYEYQIIESQTYLTIIETVKVSSGCASGSEEVENVYNIDKKSHKLVSKETIEMSVDNFDDKLEKLFNFIEKEYVNDDYQESDEQNFIEIKESIEKGEYHLYYSKDNNLVISFVGYSPVSNPNVYEFINNEWENKF